MADIDQIIAGGAGASSRADFSGIPKILDNYWAGLDQRAKNDLRDAFKPTADNPNGVPMKDGQIDIPTIAKTLFQKGDIAGGTGLLGTAQAAQDRTDYIKSLEPQAPPQAPPQARMPLTNAPSPSRSIQGQVAPKLSKGGAQDQESQPPQGGFTTTSYLAAAGIPNGEIEKQAASLSNQLGISPTDVIDTNDPRIRNVIIPAVAFMKRSGIGQVQPPQPGDGQPMQAPVPQGPQVAQAQPQVQAPQGFQPSPAQAAAQNDPELKRAKYFAASRDKEIAASALAEQKAIQESRQPTNAMKEARDSGITLQQYQDRQGEQAAQQAGASELAKTQVGEQQAIISQGRQAGVRLGTTNLMTNIIQSDKNLDLGFGSASSLKIKMALERFGFDTGDLSGAQLLQKFNSILAAESTKGVTSRGTNFDMKTFIANNPGLAMDEKGNIRMLGILSQHAKREYDLGKLVPKNRDNWDNWDNVVEAYDKKNPIKDPTTGKILSNDSIIAPGPKQAPQAPQASQSAKQTPSSIPTFALKADRDAAIASGKLKKGDSFIGGDGVERFVP